MQLIPQIFQILDTPIDKYHATVLLGVCELIGAILCVLLVRFTGKRPLVFLSLIASTLCFSSTAFYAHYYGISPQQSNSLSDVSAIQMINQTEKADSPIYLKFSLKDIDLREQNLENLLHLNETTRNKENDTPVNTASKLKNSWIPLALLLTCALFTHIGIGLIPWALIGEMYPAHVRSGASGLSSGSGYLFAFFSNKLFLWMLDTLTLPGTFWFYSSVSIIGKFHINFNK